MTTQPIVSDRSTAGTTTESTSDAAGRAGAARLPGQRVPAESRPGSRGATLRRLLAAPSAALTRLAGTRRAAGPVPTAPVAAAGTATFVDLRDGMPPGITTPDDVATAPHGGDTDRPEGTPLEAPSRLRLLGARVTGRHLDVALAAALATVVAVVQGRGVFGYPSLSDDEGTYVAQAAAVRAGELAHYTYWYDHPPLGWIQLGLLDWLPRLVFPGAHPVAASRVVMVAASAVSAVLLLALARRLGFSRPFAALAVVLAFLSPLSVVLQRQVYLDNIATPWVLLAFLLLLDPRHRLGCYLASGLAFAMAVLTKETTLILLPALLWGVWRAAPERLRVFSVCALLSGTTLVVFYPLMALLRSELVPGAGHVSLVDAVLFQLVDRPGSGAVWQAGSGSHGIFESWVYQDPWLLGLGLAALPVALVVPRLRLVGVALLILTLVALKPGGYLPAMYVIAALPLLGLAAAGAMEVVLDVLRAAAARIPWRWRVQDGGRRSALRSGTGVVAAVAVAGFLAAPWLPALAPLMSTQSNDARTSAEAWLATNLPAGDVVLADDVSWVQLVESGTTPRDRAVWFYKLDTDPAVQQQLPGGWRDVDYVLSTDQLRNAVSGNPALTQAASALERSEIVAAFGEGDGRVEIRKVTP